MICGPPNHIFNKSSEILIIPEDWKSANVTAIHKKGNRQESGNYGPISLTSVVCKTMKRLVKLKIIAHLEGNNLIGDSQQGFRNKCSCLTSLLASFLVSLTPMKRITTSRGPHLPGHSKSIWQHHIKGKISKFAEDTKLCHSPRHPDEVLELQEDLCRLVDWANKWQMNLNINKCAVLYIGHNNIQHNYTMENQQLISDRRTTRSRNHHNQRPQVKKVVRQQSTRIHCP